MDKRSGGPAEKSEEPFIMDGGSLLNGGSLFRNEKLKILQ